MKRRLTALLLAFVLLCSGALALDDLPQSRYADALDTLDQGAQKVLFEDVLGSLARFYGGEGLDSARLTEAQLGLLCAQLRTTSFPDAPQSAALPAAQFTVFCADHFGREPRLSALPPDRPPAAGEGDATWTSGGTVYLPRVSPSTLPATPVTPLHLYRLGSGRFCAVFSQTALHAAVVERNSAGGWRVLRLFPADFCPTPTQLKDYGLASDWARDEVAWAQNAGLVPTLTDDPGPQGTADRLQFVQLAVRLAESLTGQTLPAAPADVFADCDDLSVRKAVRAGLVNGVGEGLFQPQGTLTREQLAAMLWRTVSFVQGESGKTIVPQTDALPNCRDSGRVSPWARTAVASLAAAGVMKGTGVHTLEPQAPCTIEQAILLASRAYALF